MVKRYRKKPVVIEALEWTGKNLKEVVEFLGEHDLVDELEWKRFEDAVKNNGLRILTLEGLLKASAGDFIIKGIEGEFYPCKPGIFNKTYSEVT